MSVEVEPGLEPVIIDTNTFVSGLILAGSTPAAEVDYALERCLPIFSISTFAELVRVFTRPKFDRYVSLSKREELLRFVEFKAHFVRVQSKVTICRDVKDNQFLELALDGQASSLVTGDLDLLAHDPFGSCRIITAAQFHKSEITRRGPARGLFVRLAAATTY